MWHIIVNPQAGDRTAEEFVNTQVIPLLDSKNQPYKLHTTTSQNDAARIGNEINQTPSPHKVIIAGGDGTAHEMMEGISSGRWELVILPLGTANALYHSFLPNDETKLASLNLALDGKTPRRLPVTYTDLGGKSIPSTIVTSTALHAAILKDSEALRANHGIERYAMAAEANLTVFFDATVKLINAKQWDHRLKEWKECHQDLEGPFTYLVSCTVVDRLEPKFVIAPTRRIGTAEELEETMDVVIMRPLRDPKVQEATDKGSAWAERVKVALGAAYQNGSHVELEYDDGEVVVEVFRCTGFVWVPGDEKSRVVCADGSLYEIPEGGKASVKVQSGGEEGFWAWL